MHAMGSWEGRAAPWRAGVVRTGAGGGGGLISVERAQPWCWMALEVNYT